MATEVKFRRGTTAQMDAFTGALAELNIDTDRDEPVIHDGVLAGGHRIPGAKAIQDQEVLYATDTGAADAYAIAPAPAIAAYVEGQRFVFKAANANTGSSTLNVNGKGAVALKKYEAGAKVDLVSGDIAANQVVEPVHDGTHFVVTSGGGGAGGLTSISNVAIAAATNLDVTGFLPGTYDNYEVWLSNGKPNNDNQVLEMETSTDGGSTFDTGGSDYTWVGLDIQEAATLTGRADAADSEIQLVFSGAVGNLTNEGINLKISIFGPEVAEYTAFVWSGRIRDNAGKVRGMSGMADRKSAADVNALRFHYAAGDHAAQGKIQFLGIVQ